MQSANFALKGTHNIFRKDSSVKVKSLRQNNTFEVEDSAIGSETSDSIICRVLYRKDSYWVYHKQLIDENSENVLEKKPEEKIWQVVKENYPPEMEFACFKLKKRDLIKVGRVRFKIRDIMSPVYSQQHKTDE